jgi:hypothetical protein
VAVPWVITTPARGASRRAASSIVSIKRSQSAGPMDELATALYGAGTTVATRAVSG